RASRPASLPRRLHAYEPAILGAEVVLVWLVAAQQVVDLEALRDRVAHGERVARDAERQRRERGIVRGVVERERVAVRESEEHRRIFVIRAHDAEAQPPERCEGVGDVAEERLRLFRHERRLLALGEAMQREEAIEHPRALAVFGPVKPGAARTLEAAQLTAQLVALFLSQPLHV